MVEIGFYHLRHSSLERALPKLLEKVLERGHRAVVLAGSKERVEILNTILWTYEANSWLPHGSAGDGPPEAQPIFLTAEEENPNGADVLVTIDDRKPTKTEGFVRIIDMFDGQSKDLVSAARLRWQTYKELGFNMTYWQQSETGGWEKK